MHPDEAVALGAAYYAVHCARHQEIVENGEFEHPPSNPRKKSLRLIKRWHMSAQ